MESKLWGFLMACLMLFLSLTRHPARSQQAYLNNTCSFAANNSGNEGYHCTGYSAQPCTSFVLFRSRPSCPNPKSIAQLLNAEASEIAALHAIARDARLRPGELVTVPLLCLCPVSYFQHFTTYVVQTGDTYHSIANITYQGLTTCRALISQNPGYDVGSITSDLTEIFVRIRCACPSDNQTASGVAFMLTYVVQEGDTVGSIGTRFGASAQSILDANMLSPASKIVANTPVLVPLTKESCSENLRMFFRICAANGGVGTPSADGLTCIPPSRKSFLVNLMTLIGISIGLVLVCLFLSIYKLRRFIKKRREIMRKEAFFKQNGGLLLQQKLASNCGAEAAKLFTAEELQRATDNYSPTRLLGQGGFGTVYKGMLPDGSVVAVKTSKVATGARQVEQFINEVVTLSLVNHRNIVRLLGFCLETETAILVNEFISNGTLSQHLGGSGAGPTLSWENRLSVACDVAGALAYMHSSVATPIFHRDVKSSNILLDDKYNAKVSDFGTSRSVLPEKRHLTTAVQGTMWYSFRVTLIELLTGENPYSFAGNHDGKNLISTFVLLVPST